jgi:ferredoxin
MKEIILKINNQEVQVESGTTVMEAARSIGIEIPSMCYVKGLTNHPSCMICVVKDGEKGALQCSCSLPAGNDMNIITDDEEIHTARKEALELLLADHVGDCEAPCTLSCPAHMDIPRMNRLTAEGKFEDAFKCIQEEIALPLILGSICQAPCEGACRRKELDEPVAICKIKQFNGLEHYNSKQTNNFTPVQDKKIAVIGSGISGLAAAWEGIKAGYKTVVFEAQEIPGGSLLNISNDRLDPSHMNTEIDYLQKSGVEIKTKQKIDRNILKNELLNKFDAVILCCGKSGNDDILDLLNKHNYPDIKNKFKTDINGLFVAGDFIKPKKMPIRALAEGKDAMRALIKWLETGNFIKTNKSFNSRFGKLRDEEKIEYQKEGSFYKRVINNAPVEIATSKDTIKEAKRCLHCDCRALSNCKLKIYSEEYGADRKRFAFDVRKSLKKYIDNGPLVYEPEKCIRCGICVDIAGKNTNQTGLTFIGRGFDVRIDIPFNKELNEAIKASADECAEKCPTGALHLK